MPLVKKINEQWRPKEKPDLPIGGMIDMSDATALVELGMAVYCDANGNELVYPGGMQYKFPITLQNTEEAQKFVQYYLSKGKITHDISQLVPKVEEKPVEKPVEKTVIQEEKKPEPEPKPEVKVEIDPKRQQMLERLAKARAARMAKLKP